MSIHQDVRVWDPAIRVFHWTLVPAFVIAYLSGEEILDLHVVTGYLIGGLVGFRVLWGIIGTRHARFSDFVRSPRTIGEYLRSLFGGRPQHYLGHNPAGGAMVVALLVMLALTTLSGLAVYGGKELAGPMAFLATTPFLDAKWLEGLHEVCANLTVALILAHIAGVLVSSLLHGENLVRAMITGTKRSPQHEQA
jgi:cytochrome b